MTKSGKVSIITVNYRQSVLTCDFLQSVIKHTEGDDVEVLLVDNGSMVDQGPYFEGIYPGVKYIRSVRNLGFAGANNLAVAQASGDYLLFLNNDTEITEGFVSGMRDELEAHPEIGLLSSLILYFEDKTMVQYAGYTAMNYLTARNEGIGVMDQDTGQHDHITELTGYCHGASMMCRKADLGRVGLMEENYFLYYEELDWCEKFKRAGLEIGFTGKAKIYHKESMSVGKESPLKTYFMTRNRWLFIRRNAKAGQRFVFACYYLLVAVPVTILRSLRRGRLDLAGAAFRGMWWNLTNSTKSADLGWTLPDV